MHDHTRRLVAEVTAPSVCDCEAFKSALEAFMPAFTAVAQQAQREMEALQLAELRESDPDVRASFEGMRQRIGATLRLHAEIAQRFRALVQARELVHQLAPTGHGEGAPGP